MQAYIGAPITATFLLGILWKGGTSRAAISTLIFGGLAGAGRFALDILYKAYGVNLGPLEGLVQIPFLNYSVAVFAACLALFWVVSKLDEKPVAGRIAGLTFDWHRRLSEAEGAGTEKLLQAMTALVGVAVLMLWFYFR